MSDTHSTIGLHNGPHDGEHAPGGPGSPDVLRRGGAVYVITAGGVEGHDPLWHYCHRPQRAPGGA